MAALSRLGRQIQEVITTLNGLGVRFALIGGLALASHRVIRATQDIDLLTDAEKADQGDRELTRIGYRCVHRSPDAGNYLRGDERVDLLYAARPIARKLLAAAPERATAFGDLRVIGLEGLIGLKLQGFVNDPRRTQDLEDIRALMRAKSPESRHPAGSVKPLAADSDSRQSLDNGDDPYERLDELMAVVGCLCLTWPPREVFREMRHIQL